MLILLKEPKCQHAIRVMYKLKLIFNSNFLFIKEEYLNTKKFENHFLRKREASVNQRPSQNEKNKQSD